MAWATGIGGHGAVAAGRQVVTVLMRCYDVPMYGDCTALIKCTCNTLRHAALISISA